MGFYWKISACIFAIIAYGLGLWLFPASLITLLLGILIGSWLASLLHELGHLAAYRLLKLEWRRLEFSFLVFQPGKGIHIDRQKRFFAAGCTCAYDPSVPYWRYRIALLSGALFCLLLCISTAVFCFFLSGRIRECLLCFSIATGLNAIINLLPFSTDQTLLMQIKQERENFV